MRRVIRLAIAGLFYATSAAAQPVSCLDPTQAFSWSYAGDPIGSITYYLDKQVLSVAYVSGIIHLASSVPLNTAQRFQTIGHGVSPDAIWNSIRGMYREILQAQNHCPLLAQDGNYLLASPSRKDTP